MSALAHGIVVPTITIFGDDDEIDSAAMSKHIDWLVNSGASGIVVGGSSGEFLTLDNLELKRLITIALNVCHKRVPVYAATGRYSTRETFALTQWAHSRGAAGAMIVCPYYMHPSTDEVIGHFVQIRNAVGSDWPIILYNNPGTVGYELPKETIVSLNRGKIIQGAKCSQGPSTAALDLRIAAGPHRKELTVYYGHDFDPIDAIASGADGWLSGILNVFPSLCTKMWTYAQEGGHFAELMEIWNTIAPITKYIWIDHKVHPIAAYKDVLKLLDHPVGKPRAPLTELKLLEYRELEKLLKPAREMIQRVTR